MQLKNYAVLIENNKILQELKKEFPFLSPVNLVDIYADQLNRNLYNHVLSHCNRLTELKKNINISDKDYFESLIAIFYHDCAKVLGKFVRNNISLKKILALQYGHSIAARRLFFYFDQPRMAHHLRHNSTDFVLDIANRRVTIPQLLLNVLDKTDISGKVVSVEEKYASILQKIGHHKEYDDFSEKIACKYITRVLKTNFNFREYEFLADQNIPSINVLFLQRFDGKYCPPIGKYKDTNSNLKIAEFLSRWGYNSEILHEGNFKKIAYDGSVKILGCDKNTIDDFLPIYVAKKDLVLTEGSTRRCKVISKIKPALSAQVLLLRTLATGKFSRRRACNALSADEVWVMTDEMKSIIEQSFNKYFGNNKKVPSVKVLQSGYDPKYFYVDEKIKRIKGKIVYVGAVSKIKGVDILLKSFKKVKAKLSYAQLHIVGDPYIYGYINKFDLSKLKKINGVVYHGVCSASDVAKHLKTAHVAVLATRIYETFGKAAQQARLCGTKLIVSKNGFLPFHVQSKEEGIVLDTLNADSLSAALFKILLEDPQTVPPPIDRYHFWRITALDFITHYNLLSRRVIQKLQRRS